MVFRGVVKGGMVVLDRKDALPDGTAVRVAPLKQARKAGRSPAARLLRHAGTVRGLPPDMAENHDHYLHGTPKK